MFTVLYNINFDGLKKLHEKRLTTKSSELMTKLASSPLNSTGVYLLKTSFSVSLIPRYALPIRIVQNDHRGC